MEENNNENEKKNNKIEIIQGNPKELDISDVKDHLPFEIQNDKMKKQNIIIPEIKKKDEN